MSNEMTGGAESLVVRRVRGSGNAFTSDLPYHLGVATSDLDSTITSYRNLLGVGPWVTRVVEGPVWFRGRQSFHSTRMAMAAWGRAYLEVVEPLAGDSPAAEFLLDHGEGIYHVGYFWDDLESLPPNMSVMFSAGSSSDTSALYLDTLKSLGMYIELVNGNRRSEFVEWVASASARVDEAGGG